MPSFLHHLVEASLPVLKICLLGAVGAGLARAGILEQQGRRTLSKLIYCLFTPALTFSKLAPVLTGQHLLQWMPLALNMFVSVGAGLLLGLLLLVVLRLPAGLRRHVLVATALGNAGNLPLVLVAALVRETGGRLFPGEVLSEDLAIAYVAMGIWAATITHFTIGTELLKLPPEQQQQQRDMQQQPGPQRKQGGGGSSSDAGYTAAVSHGAAPHGATCVVELGVVQATAVQQQQQQQQQHSRVTGAAELDGVQLQGGLCRSISSSDCLVLAAPAAVMAGGDGAKGTCCVSCGSQHALSAAGVGAAADGALQQHCRVCGAVQHAAAGSPGQQQQQDEDMGLHGWRHGPAGQEGMHLLGPSAGPHSSDGSWQQQQQQASTSGSRPSSKGMRVCGRVMRVVVDVLGQLGSPPMVGCMLAVAVGLTRPVRDALFSPTGQLAMLQDCISMFGDCCIPCLLLMLGATLSKGPGNASPPWRVVAGVAAARLVLLPLLGTGWLVLAKATGLLWAPDKMFILVMLVQNAVPTALNVHTLATLHNNRDAEMGAMLFWQYLAACITLPAALSFFLWLLNSPVMSVGH